MIPTKGTPTLKLEFNTCHSYLRLDDCVPEPLVSVLIYTIIVGPFSLMSLIKRD